MATTSGGWPGPGTIPLGYLGDEAKTARTFPTVGGVRMVVPGDRARLLADGMVELLGRDAATINSGGEKIFAEEVEQALLADPRVDDALVFGRESERWGQEVVAVVQLAAAVDVTDAELLDHVAGHLARYKLPKVLVRVPRIERTPSGKADYRWARAQLDGRRLSPSSLGGLADRRPPDLAGVVAQGLRRRARSSAGTL